MPKASIDFHVISEWHCPHDEGWDWEKLDENHWNAGDWVATCRRCGRRQFWEIDRETDASRAAAAP